MSVSLVGRDVEFGRPECVLSIVSLTPVPLLELLWRNQLLHFFLVGVSKDQHLLVCELVDKLVSQFPQLPHNEGHISCIEAEKSTPVILGHRLDQTLNPVLGNLSSANVFEVKNGGPTFNFARNHGLPDHVVKEEIAHGNQTIQVDASVDHSAHIDNNYGVHHAIATKPIQHAQV